MAARSESNTLELTRIYDAPLAAVWDAWTDPGQLAKWWGPRGFTLTTHKKELRPGGTWRYTMHGPDGRDYPNVAHYFEVEKHRKLVYDHGATDDTPPLFRVTVSFSEVRGGTKMEMRMALPTPEAAAETRQLIQHANGDSTWDRLAEYLEEERSGRELFVINRSFDAPLERMYAVWTSPEHLAKWVPPTGFEMQFLEADIREGGGARYVMTGPGGMKMYGRTRYLELRRPDRIVYTQQFCDEHGNVSRHPMAPTWPETMRTTVTLAAEGPDRTRVTVQWEPVAPVTAEERATFVKGRSGMTQGWTGSFDKLEAYVDEGRVA